MLGDGERKSENEGLGAFGHNVLVVWIMDW